MSEQYNVIITQTDLDAIKPLLQILMNVAYGNTQPDNVNDLIAAGLLAIKKFMPPTYREVNNWRLFEGRTWQKYKNSSWYKETPSPYDPDFLEAGYIITTQGWYIPEQQ